MLIDQHGRPLRRQAPAGRGRFSAGLLGRGGHVPFDAADQTSQEMVGWNPLLGSPDADSTPYRDRIVARIRDLVRNDGWASGGVTSILDSVVGPGLRLSAKPDYRALRQWAKGFDAVWAKEFADAAQAAWRDWGNDPLRYADTARRHSIAEIQRLAFRSYLIEGDAIAALPWRPERRGYGQGSYATTVQLIHADRLSNPQDMPDTAELRGGVVIDGDGVAVGYEIRQGHMADLFVDGFAAYTWVRMPRETPWGRPVVVHYFDAEDIGQHRSAGGILKAVVPRLRMLAKYDATELQAAIINAIFAAFIESPSEFAGLDTLSDATEPTPYMDATAAYYGDKTVSLSNGARIASLYPGEKLSTLEASRPATNFAGFESAVLRNAASALGITYEQLSKDWSQTNYSSARAALIEAWRTMSRRREHFAAGFNTPIYVGLMEEAMDLGHLPLPAGAPDFAEARGAYTACRWIGPGRGFVDPVKEATGAQLRVEMGISTLEAEAAELSGVDIEDVLDQRALEVEMFRARKLPVPASLISPDLLKAAMTSDNQEPR